MNSTSFFSNVGNGFRNLFHLQSIDNTLSLAELKSHLQIDVIFNQLHQRLAEGADLKNPKLTIFQYKKHTITLLNYTNENIGFNKRSFLFCRDSSGWVSQKLEFAKEDCKVIAYNLEYNPEYILFEQQDVYRSDTTTERLFVKLGAPNFFVGFDISNISKNIFFKKKEHQKDAITLLINASRFDPKSAFNIIPIDIITAIFARYEDALKKEFPSQYRG